MSILDLRTGFSKHDDSSYLEHVLKRETSTMSIVVGALSVREPKIFRERDLRLRFEDTVRN